MTVTASASYPSRHASLSDGTTTIEFILVDGDGKPNERAFRAMPYPRTALKTATGESKYSDLEPPYFAIAQDDFTGGRGNEDFESDTSRYFDGYRCDTSKESGVILGGQETYTTGYRQVEQAATGSIGWTQMLNTEDWDLYYSTSFTSADTWTSTQCEVLLRRVGTPQDMKVELWSDSGGEPDAMVATKTMTAASVTSDTLGVPVLVPAVWTSATGIEAATYHVVNIFDAADTTVNCWWLGTQTGVNGLVSTDTGANWSVSGSAAPYYRVTPAAADFNAKFFEYKSGMYMVTQPDSGGNSALYINGDRGAADSNAAAKTTLVDATKSWTTNEWVGSRVLITNGPGSEEEQNWRTVSSNTGTSLTVSPAWNTTHTTSTEYVILGTDKWTAIDSDLDVAVTDVAVTGNYIYMGHGEDDPIRRYRYYNASGTWTAEADTTSSVLFADKLLSIRHPESGETLYASVYSNAAIGIGMYRGMVPKETITTGAANHLYNSLYEFDTGIAWVDSDYTNASSTLSGVAGGLCTKITIAAGHTTGYAASMNIDALDMRAATHLMAEIYSDTALALGDYEFVFDDVEDLVENNSPSKVFHNATVSGAQTFTDKTVWYDGKTAATTGVAITWADDDFVFVGYSKPFNKVTWNVNTVNSETATMTAFYFNGSSFTTVGTLTDGTLNGGATLGQDGTMSWTMPIDWVPNTINSVEAYWVYFNASAALTDPITVLDMYVTRQNNINADISAIAAGTWTTVFININDSDGVPDFSSIKSIGLNVAVDKGANNFWIRRLALVDQLPLIHPDYHLEMQGGSRINGLQAYAGNVDDPVLNPWVFTTNAVYELQTQNDYQLVKIPLEELGALSSSENGLAHCVNGTYLFFNIGEKIERYFNRTLDDVGPDRDEGLSDDRPGIPKSLASYPGRVYAAIDAGASGTSSVLAIDGTAWHEVYRAPQAGRRIKSIYIQAIPGTNVDRLWISMGSDVLWVPISLHPYTETDYTYTYYGSFETSWIYANMLDVVKLWKSLKMFMENADSTQYIIADYKVDNDSAWTTIGSFSDQPVEEQDIASTLPQSKRIKFRFRFHSNDDSESPRLKAYVVEGVAFVPVKYQYAMSIRVTQGEDDINLDGVHQSTLDADAQFDKLVSWANTGQPLTLRHKSDLYDNKTVFIDPVSIQPVREVSDEGIEYHVAQLTCIEV